MNESMDSQNDLDQHLVHVKLSMDSPERKKARQTMDLESRGSLCSSKSRKLWSLESMIENNFYISQPLTLDYFWSVRGSENFHIYLWIAKDMAWAQDWYWPAMVFGTAALAWCFVLLHHAIYARNYEEIYLWVSFTLWLAANFVWMSGEVFNGDDDYVLTNVSIVMETAVAWILFAHLVLKPFKVFPPFDYAHSHYNRPGLVPRFSYFENWRQYENIHTLCWLGKDLSWNRLSPVPWIMCLIPTVVIAADFIFITVQHYMWEDTIHYISQLMWVIGNMFWALGNIFIDTDDEARTMFLTTRNAPSHMRWIAGWVLFAAYWPIIILYSVWIPLTLYKKFPEQQGMPRRTSMIGASPIVKDEESKSETMSPLGRVSASKA